MRTWIVLCLIILWSGCKKFEVPETPVVEFPTEEWEAPMDFDFETITEITLRLGVINNKGKKLKNIPFSVNLSRSGSLDLLSNGFIGEEAWSEETFTLPEGTEELIVTTDYVGLPYLHRIPITSSFIEYIIGADQIEGFSGMANHLWLEWEPSFDSDGTENLTIDPNIGTQFTYLGPYDELGTPSYLEAEPEEVSLEVLEMLNASFPERRPLSETHPDFLAGSRSSHLTFREDTDVSISFLHQSSGFHNALGYYVYDTSNPPQKREDIDTLFVIFPNVAYRGNDGGLKSGDQVNLGRFKKGQSIGWFLVPDGWNKTEGKVIPKNHHAAYNLKFSSQDLNNFTASAFRPHFVLLSDPDNQGFVLGVEEVSRPLGDQDFNDGLFRIVLSKYRAVNIDELPEVSYRAPDDDGDLVNNFFDEFPNDARIAFRTYFPGKGNYSSLAFEDLWPRQGDLDMNDLVVDFSYTQLRSPEGIIWELEAEFVIKAIGAGFRNGFGVEFPFSSSQVSNVTGTELTGNYIYLNENGTEKGHAKAVVIVSDDVFRTAGASGAEFFNTEPRIPFQEPDRIELKITFAEALEQQEFGKFPFNPFLIVNRTRGREVHLSQHTPTDLADLSLFGTDDDVSNSSLGVYYRTKRNLPWALFIPYSFQYPKEKIPLTDAYMHFQQWAVSNGTDYIYWYEDLPGYRDDRNIYK